MAINLTPYRSVQTNLFIKLVIPDYQTLTFSDYHRSYTINGTAYTGLGQLLSVSNSTNNLRAAPEEVTVTISGIPVANVTDIINNKVRGSQLTIYRAFFDPITGVLLPISGNPAGKFQGVVANYNVSDELDMGSSNGTITLTLNVKSVVEMLNNKVTGRRTNPIDQKLYYPSDLSMDRVTALAKSNFNFGAPN